MATPLPPGSQQGNRTKKTRWDVGPPDMGGGRDMGCVAGPISSSSWVSQHATSTMRQERHRVLQRFLVALDHAILSSEFIGGKDLFNLSTTCRTISTMVRLKALAIGGPPRVLLQHKRYPLVQRLTIRFTLLIQKGPFAWVTKVPVEKLQAGFQVFCQRKLQSLSICFDANLVKRRHDDIAVVDPYMIFLPGLLCASRLTSLRLETKNTKPSKVPMDTLRRIFTQATFPNLVNLTITGRHSLGTLAGVLLTAINRDVFPRLQSIVIECESSSLAPAEVEPVTTLIRYLVDGTHLRDMRSVSLLGHCDLGCHLDRSSVLGRLWECWDELDLDKFDAFGVEGLNGLG